LIKDCDCLVIGADPATNMRTFASDYVNSHNFILMSPFALDELGVKVDFALAIWVLQHCLRPKEDIERIKRTLKPDGKLIVLNNDTRSIPTTESSEANPNLKMVDDSIKVRSLLEEHFSVKDLELKVPQSSSLDYSFCVLCENDQKE